MYNNWMSMFCCKYIDICTYMYYIVVPDLSDYFSDTFREDYLLTHVIYMPANHLCPTLMAQYPYIKKSFFRYKNIIDFCTY